MEHDHSGNTINKEKHNKIKLAFFITLLFAFVEFIAGDYFNSLALVADAGHMITDSIALLIASIAIYLSSKPANEKYTFGIGKVEIAAAIINLVLIFIVIIDIGYEAYTRINADIIIDALGVILVATFGLFVNIIVFFMLHYGYENLNTRAAKLHVIGDLIGSIAAIISGLMIYFYDLVIFDPIMSAIVCFILLKMSFTLMRSILHTILDAVPEEVDIAVLQREIMKIDKKILSIHDMHIWKSSDKEISLTAHIDLVDLSTWNDILFKINEKLSEYKVTHVTIQPEKMISNK
jgi:cobalt-zinc-cadmium efflux system protein